MTPQEHLQVLVREARAYLDKPDATEEGWKRHELGIERAQREVDHLEAEEVRKATGLDEIVRPLQYRDSFNQADKPWMPTMREYRAALAEGSGATGGVVIADQQANTFFDMLRAKSVVLAAGPRLVRMTSDVCNVPKILTSTTTGWYDEGGTLSSTEMTFEAVTLTARKVAAYSLCSNEALADGNPQLLNMVGQDFATAMALGIDLVFLDGSGTPPTPRGIRNFTSVTETAADTNGATPTMNMLLEQVGRLEALDANIDRMAYFMHPRDWKSIKNFLDDEGQLLLNPTPTEKFKRSLFGIPVFLSTQISTGETEGGSGAVCSSIILADMDQIVVGFRQEIDLKYSTDFAFNLDSTALRATARCDIQPVNIDGVDILTGVLATS